MPKTSFKLRCIAKQNAEYYVIYSFIGSHRNSTGIKLKSKDHWNKAKECIKQVNAEPEHKAKNRKLKNFDSHIAKEVDRYEANDIEINKEIAKEIVSSFNVSPQAKRIVKAFNFNDAFSEYIEGMETGSVVNINNDRVPYSLNTIKNYKSTYKLLKEFQEKYGVIKPSNINEKLYSNLIKYLRYECEITYKNSYINKVFNHLGVVLKRKVKKSMNIKLPEYDKDDFNRLKEHSKHSIALTKDELKKMFLLDLSEKPKDWSTYRDAFLFIAYTCGIRVSDYKNCTYEQNVVKKNGVLFFFYVQSKTGNEVRVQIPPPALRILERNNNQLPLIRNKVKSLEIFKEIGEMCGIDEIEVYKEKRGIETKIIRKERYKLIQNHTARKSFCTNAYNSGMDSLTVMHYSGHKDIKVFLQYVKHKQSDHLKIYKASKLFKSYNEDKDFQALTVA